MNDKRMNQHLSNVSHHWIIYMSNQLHCLKLVHFYSKSSSEGSTVGFKGQMDSMNYVLTCIFNAMCNNKNTSNTNLQQKI